MRFRRREEAPIDDLRRDGRVVRDDVSRNDSAVREERVVREAPVGADAAYTERTTRATTDAVDAPAYTERTTRTEYAEPAAAPVYEESVMTDRRVGYLTSLPARVNAVLFAVLVAVEALIGLRFAMLAFGASRASGFVRFIYDVSWPFVRPFSNAFSNRTTDSGIIEVSSLLAIGVWLLLFILVTLIVNALLPHVEDRGASVRSERVTHN